MQISIFTDETAGSDGRDARAVASTPGDGAPPLFPALVDLAALWRALTSGACFALDSHYSDEQCFLLVERRRQTRGRHLAQSRVELLERILLGQSQKAAAIDFHLAVSTVALACSDCLRVMGRNHLSSRAPALLVMAVHAARGVVLPPARATLVATGLAEHWLLSVPRPDLQLAGDLTQAEEAVTRLLVEGHPHARIAELRLASPRTVANQLASAFRKLGISGRAELLSMLIRASAEQVLPVTSATARCPPRAARAPARHRATPRRVARIALRAEHPSG